MPEGFDGVTPPRTRLSDERDKLEALLLAHGGGVQVGTFAFFVVSTGIHQPQRKLQRRTAGQM